MIIALFGESCTGKSAIANALKEKLCATIYTGKDYERLSKNEEQAIQQFKNILADKQDSEDVLIYVISEKEHLALLPSKCLKVLVTADLSLIKERFAKRMNGKLPPPVALMLERKHGMFDGESHDVKIISEQENLEFICDKILSYIK